MHKTRPKLSVIINNYNYQEYVADAIESVLKQDPRPELIVVDDCSTDQSREIISRYANQAKLVFLEQNVGQGGAFSQGYFQARGDIVLFLDADDFMLDGAAQIILDEFDPAIAIYHFRMRYADAQSKITGMHPPPEQELAPGDISETLRTIGTYNGTVTSGMVFAKWVLDQVLPMPNPDRFRYGGDGYLTGAAPLYGPSKTVNQMITAYRLHDRQHSRFASVLAKRARFRIEHAQERYATTKYHANRLGLNVCETLGDRDSSVIFERIVSLLFDPDQHPIQAESISGLSNKYRSITRRPESKLKKLSGDLWWLLFAISPGSAKRNLMKWRVDAGSRPAWLQAAGHFIRQRLRRARALQ